MSKVQGRRYVRVASTQRSFTARLPTQKMYASDPREIGRLAQALQGVSISCGGMGTSFTTSQQQ